MPLASLLEPLEARYAARATELELRREPSGRLYYDMALLTAQGRRLTLLVDAATGQVINDAEARR